MSTEWNDEKHQAAREAAENGDMDAEGATGWAVAYLGEALDEIERLRSLARAALRSALNPEEGEQA